MKIKLNKYSKLVIMVITFLVVITFFNILNWYLNSVTPKYVDVVYAKIEKEIYSIITDKINVDLLNNQNLKDVLFITSNEDGEILTVDYNLEKAYTVNNLINESIRTSLNELESGELESDEFISTTEGIYIELPFFIYSSNTILSSMGPLIPIKISFIGTVVTNLETRITDYGLNNVLNEIYVTVEISQLLTTPVSSEEVVYNYDILIDATMINGRVPTYYGSEIISQSSILDVPLE